MKKTTLILFVLLCSSVKIYAQIGITMDSVGNAKCNGSLDGYIAFTITNPNGIFSIDLNGIPVANGQGPANYSQILYWQPAGTYIISCTDANTTTATTVIITQPPTLNTYTVSATTPGCGTLANTGAASVASNGGVIPYTYSINNSGTINPTTGQASQLTTGNYIITATDNNACMATTSVTITNSASPIVNTIITPSTCDSSCNGSFVINAFGGAGGYQYLLSSFGGLTNNSTFNSLCNGNYNFQVIDANACITYGTASISSITNAGLTVNTTNNCINNTMSFTAVITGNPTPPISYMTTPGNYTTAAVSNIPQNYYQIIATDANGCTILENIYPGSNTTNPLSMSLLPITCGQTTAIATFSGATTYTVNGIAIAGNTAIVTGNISVAGTDMNGCVYLKLFNVDFTEYNPLLNLITTNACGGGATGTIYCSLIGGFGTNYTFTPGGITNFSYLSNLSPGAYSVTAVNNKGCIASAQAVIIPSTNPSMTTYNTGNSIAPIITNGTPPYLYNFASNISYVFTDTVTPCVPTVFTISVSDAVGCSTTIVDSTTIPNAILINSSTIQQAQCAGGLALLEIEASGGVGPYTFTTPNGNLNGFGTNSLQGYF